MIENHPQDSQISSASQPDQVLALPESKQARTRLSWRRRVLTTLTLATVTAAGGVTSSPVVSGQDSGGDSIGASVTKSSELNASQLQSEIENEYSIQLITQQDVIQMGESNFFGPNQLPDSITKPDSLPQAGWNSSELKIMEEVLPNVPTSLLAPIDGKVTQIFSGEFMTVCGCEGIDLWDSGVIGIGQELLNIPDTPDSRGQVYKAILHEGTHEKDFITKHAIWPKITEIIGDQATVKANLKAKKDTIMNMTDGPALVEAFASFANEGGHRNFLEGVAELTPIFALGPTRSMKVLRAMIGEEKAQELTDLYVNYFFGKKPFDDTNYEAVKYGVNFAIQTQKAIEAVSNQYDVNIYDNPNAQIDPEDLTSLDQLFQSFPKTFFSPIDGKKLSIVFTSSDETAQSNDRQTIYLNPDSLRFNGVVDMVDAVPIIANALTIRANELKGNEPENKLVELLGGQEFLTDPQKLYPELFTPSKDPKTEALRERFFTTDGKLISPSEMLGIFGERYVTNGQYGFIIFQDLFDYSLKQQKITREFKNAQHLTSKEYNKVTREYLDLMNSSKSSRISDIVRNNVFEGGQFSDFSKGIPILSTG